MKRLAVIAMLLVPAGVLLPADDASALSGPVCQVECRCADGRHADLVVEVGPVTACLRDVLNFRIQTP